MYRQPTPPPAALTPFGGRASATWPPVVLPYRDGQAIPDGYRLEEQHSTGLIYGGIAMWAVPYITGLVTASMFDFPRGTSWLAVPVIGPFIAMGSRKIDCDLDRIQYDPNVELKDLEQQCMDSAIDEVTAVALLTVSGLLQVSGAIVTTVGFASGETQLVRKDVAQLSLHPVIRHDRATFAAELKF